MEDLATASPTIDAVSEATLAQPSPSATLSTTAPAQSPSSQSPTSDPQEETLFKGDRSKMTPAEIESEKNMLRDYKKKTEQVAMERKKFEQERNALLEKAQKYESLQKDERFLNYLKTIAPETQAQAQELTAQQKFDLGITDEEYQKSFESKEGFFALQQKIHEKLNQSLYEKVNQLEAKDITTEAQNVIDAFVSEKDEKGNVLRPHYQSFLEDGLIDGFIRLNPADQNNPDAWAERLSQAYDFSSKIREKYYKMGQESVTASLQKKQAASTQMPSATMGDASFSGDPLKLTDREAFELAKKGIRVQ